MFLNKLPNWLTLKSIKAHRTLPFIKKMNKYVCSMMNMKAGFLQKLGTHYS